MSSGSGFVSIGDQIAEDVAHIATITRNVMVMVKSLKPRMIAMTINNGIATLYTVVCMLEEEPAIVSQKDREVFRMQYEKYASNAIDASAFLNPTSSLQATASSTKRELPRKLKITQLRKVYRLKAKANEFESSCREFLAAVQVRRLLKLS